MNVSDLRAKFQIANVQAMAHVVRERESNQTPDAYTLINGGSHFTPPADYSQWRHPWHGIPTTQGAKACGAYQHLGTTWASLGQRYGIPDFSPPNQDAGFVGGLIDRGALDDVVAGRFEDAVAKLRKEWTSLPGAAESSSSWTMEKAKALFQQYGGGVSADRAPRPDIAPPPTEGHKMGAIALPLLTQLIPQVLGLFSQRAQATIAEKTGADPKLAADFMQSMIAQVGHAVGVPVVDDQTATQAVAALTAAAPDDKAAKAKALEAQALATIDALLKAGDKISEWDQAKWNAELESKKTTSMTAIAERAAGIWDMTKSLVLNSEGQVWFLMAIVATLIGYAIYKDKWEVGLAILALLGSIAGSVLKKASQAHDYRFDGTKESSEQSRALIDAAKGAKT